MARVALLWLLVIAACARVPAPALVSEPEPAATPIRDENAARAAYRDAHASCAGIQSLPSELALQTPATPHDDPVRRVHVVEAYENLLLQTPLESPTHAALLERILRRHIAEEQWVFHQLVRQCVAPEPATLDALEYGTQILRGASTSMARSAAGALEACARLRALHPTFETRVQCPRAPNGRAGAIP